MLNFIWATKVGLCLCNLMSERDKEKTNEKNVSSEVDKFCFNFVAVGARFCD